MRNSVAGFLFEGGVKMVDRKITMIGAELEPSLLALTKVEALRRGLSVSAFLRRLLEENVPKDIRIVVGAEPSSTTRRSR